MEKLLFEAIRPWIIPFLAGIGYVSWNKWKKSNGDEPPPSPQRRREDFVFREMIEKIEESTEAHNKIAAILAQNGEKLDAMKDEVTHEMREFSREIKESMSDVNRRIDLLFRRGR